ncbi:hypothetical protein AGMMS49546_04120 [Spirochaetia bacterium]|nr:hypothetical protein AGMMS49546_04120 [Spirochaetia bacterium]
MRNKIFLGLIGILLVFSFVFIGCDMGGGGGDDGNGNNENGNNENGSALALKFNLSGAKAVYAAEAQTGGTGQAQDIRAAYAASDVLFKILEDNSVAPIMEGYTGYVPSVRFIAHSPVAGKKDIYICFSQDLYINNGENNGSPMRINFIHVKEDGSVIAILKSEGNSGNSYKQVSQYYYGGSSQNQDAVIFDAQGNLYFTVSENSNSSNTNVIYKYNPETGVSTALTAAVPNTYFQSIKVSSDGSLVFAQGNRSSGSSYASYLRVISTANPDAVENIVYSGGGGGGNINSYALQPDTKVLYISGSNLSQSESPSSYSSGIYKVSVQSTQKISWETLLDGSSIYSSFFNLVSSNYGSFGSPPVYEWVYEWGASFKTDGVVDYDKIMKLFYQAACSENIDFLWNGKRNREALEALDQTELQYIFDKRSAGSDKKDIVEKYCVKAGTNTPVTYYGDISLYSISNLTIGANGSIWGFLPGIGSGTGIMFCQILDSSGKLDLYIPQPFLNKKLIFTSTKPVGEWFYYSADINTSGSVSGYQNLYRFNLLSGNDIQNLLEYTHRDKTHLEIFDFTVGGDYIYFSGTQGVSLLAGKVDVNTLAYTELDFNRKITTIMSY